MVTVHTLVKLSWLRCEVSACKTVFTEESGPHLSPSKKPTLQCSERNQQSYYRSGMATHMHAGVRIVHGCLLVHAAAHAALTNSEHASTIPVSTSKPYLKVHHGLHGAFRTVKLQCGDDVHACK